MSTALSMSIAFLVVGSVTACVHVGHVFIHFGGSRLVIIGKSRRFLDGCARTALIWLPQHDAMLANSRALRSGVNERPS